MKLSSKILMAVIILPFLVACSPQIKNTTTETVKIYGNCGMCEATIEKAGNLKNVAKVDWNKETKMATLTYDAKQTNRDEILKRIALSGYDSDEFLAPNEAYGNLAGCCQYERTNLTVAKMENMNMVPLDAPLAITGNEVPGIIAVPMPEMKMDTISTVVDELENKLPEAKTEVIPLTKTVEVVKNKPSEVIPKKEVTPKKPVEKVVTNPTNSPKPPIKNQFTLLFDAYFAVKNELVKTSSETANLKAKNLATAISAIKMESLKGEEMAVWMKVMKLLAADAKLMASSKNIAEQRKYFITLSANMYALMKVIKVETPVYYQFCPMANDGKGANWLSQENVVKNPYYGSQMLSCGKTVETIK